MVDNALNHTKSNLILHIWHSNNYSSHTSHGPECTVARTAIKPQQKQLYLVNAYVLFFVFCEHGIIKLIKPNLFHALQITNSCLGLYSNSLKGTLYVLSGSQCVWFKHLAYKCHIWNNTTKLQSVNPRFVETTLLLLPRIITLCWGGAVPSLQPPDKM